MGSYGTVAESILDYVDFGAELISIRWHYNDKDAFDYGKSVFAVNSRGVKATRRQRKCCLRRACHEWKVRHITCEAIFQKHAYVFKDGIPCVQHAVPEEHPRVRETMQGSWARPNC